MTPKDTIISRNCINILERGRRYMFGTGVLLSESSQKSLSCPTSSPAALFTMNSFPRLISGLARKDGAWICSSCAKSNQKARTTLFKLSLRRSLHDTSKPRQNVAPTMEQLRTPFAKRNTTTMFYTLSVILGTVALSYGSVPMYKMVSFKPRHQHKANISRSAKQQDGEVNRSKHPAMAAQQASTLPRDYSQLPPHLESESPLTAPSRTSYHGNLPPSSAKSESSLARRHWRSTLLQTTPRMILLG